MLESYIAKLTSNSRLATNYTLDRVRRMAEYFNNPQESYKTIHIAGTNGKGSVSKMVFSILKEAWYSVWVFTSPYLLDISESIETNDGYIPHEILTKYFEQILALDPHTTFFEAKTIAAFLYFRDAGCEYSVIEVWIGGRIDATNIINHPAVTCITSIGWDHMEILGNTLEKIAWEKAGIIKPWVPLVTDCDFHSIRDQAEISHAPIIRPYQWDIRTNLAGEHQIANARIAYQIGLLLGITPEKITTWLLQVTHRGRCEWITPNILVDGAHNLDGIRVLASYITTIRKKFEHIEFIVSLKDGKNPREIFAQLEPLWNFRILGIHHKLTTDPSILSSKLWWIEIITPQQIHMEALRSSNTLFIICGSLYGMSEFYRQICYKPQK